MNVNPIFTRRGEYFFILDLTVRSWMRQNRQKSAYFNDESTSKKWLSFLAHTQRTTFLTALCFIFEPFTFLQSNIWLWQNGNQNWTKLDIDTISKAFGLICAEVLFTLCQKNYLSQLGTEVSALFSSKSWKKWFFSTSSYKKVCLMKVVGNQKMIQR